MRSKLIPGPGFHNAVLCSFRGVDKGFRPVMTSKPRPDPGAPRDVHEEVKDEVLPTNMERQ